MFIIYQDVSKNDSYCWVCHEGGEVLCCDHCPRVFHIQCSGLAIPPSEDDDWICPVCKVQCTCNESIHTLCTNHLQYSISTCTNNHTPIFSIHCVHAHEHSMLSISIATCTLVYVLYSVSVQLLSCRYFSQYFLQNVQRKPKRSRPTGLKDLLILAVERMSFQGVSVCVLCVQTCIHVYLNANIQLQMYTTYICTHNTLHVHVQYM